MSLVQHLAGFGAAALERLRRSGDREYEMLGNRLAIGGLIALYSLLFLAGSDGEGHRLPLLRAAYLTGAILLVAHPLARPGPSRGRRLAAVFMDISVLSYGFHLGGAIASPFFAIYLWIILGNGFRFGLPWLHVSTAASIIGFGLVLLFTPYWWNNLPLGMGLLIGLLAIPLYAGRLIRVLSQAKHQAEEASRAKSLFLASISHELRTPLNAVTGMTNLLAATPLTAEQREMAGTIANASQTLLSLIDGVLDLSRIEAGRMPVASTPFDLCEVLGNVMDLVSIRAREKGLRTALHITSRTPLDLVGDPRHLSEIVLNLVSNAVKFTPSGSVVLAADAVPNTAGGCQLQIEVTDTGIGIAAEAQKRIFDDFVQADGTILNRFGGTGLGLAITSRLVSLHSGRVAVRSVEGQGSTFTVVLPMTVAEPATPHLDDPAVLVETKEDALQPFLQRMHIWRRTASGVAGPLSVPQGARGKVWLTGDPSVSGEDTSSGPSRILVADPGDGLPPPDLRERFITIIPANATDGQLAAALRLGARFQVAANSSDPTVWTRVRRLRVLIADDNAVNTRVLDLTLRRAGHATTVVRDGEQALDAMEASDFDIVLMDLNMPVMTGLEATKLYRFGALGRPHLPIVGLTADVTNEVQKRCREAGMDRCLLKPIEPGILLDMIDDLTRQHDPQLAGTSHTLPGAVTEIASHPRFCGGGAAVSLATVAQLRKLGGDEFFNELIGDFLADAGRLHASLAMAAKSGDMAAVAADAHALHSAAGNMGAEPVRQLCRALQGLSRADMTGRGQHLLDDLSRELARVTGVLEMLRARDDLSGTGRRETAASALTLPLPR